MGAEFRPRSAFKLLASTVLPNKSLTWCYKARHHGKGPMDGVGGTVKTFVFRKAKSGQIVIYSPREFCEAANTFVSSILAVHLPESETIIEPKGIEVSRKIKEILKVHKLERKCNQNGDIRINFFKIAGDKEPFHVQWYGGENAVICGHDKTSDSDSQCPNGKEEYKEKNGYVAPCANVSFVRNAFMNNQS